MTLSLDSDWGSGFIGTIKVENTGDIPLEAWRLSFDTNFTLEDVRNAQIFSTENNRYTISSSYANASIAAHETVSFGFRGTKDGEITPELSNISMSEIFISSDFDDVTVIMIPSPKPLQNIKSMQKAYQIMDI